MALKPKKIRREPTIDMGPFSDMAFLLICFFVITASFVQPMGKFLDIPQASKETKAKTEEKDLTINVKRGKIEIGKGESKMRTVGVAALREDLIQRDFGNKEEKDRMIVLNMEDGVPYETFFAVITAVSKAEGIVVLIEEEEGDSKEKGESDVKDKVEAASEAAAEPVTEETPS